MKKLKYIGGPPVDTKYGRISNNQVFEVSDEDYSHLVKLGVFVDATPIRKKRKERMVIEPEKTAFKAVEDFETEKE